MTLLQYELFYAVLGYFFATKFFHNDCIFRLFLSMYQHVRYKIAWIGKVFVTLTPFIRFFPSVCCMVVLKM